jgi:hypothetical protein
MVKDLKRALLENMREFMLEADPGYEQGHIDRCGAILDKYVLSIASAANEEDARECVRKAVQELNVLNEDAGESLIETGEREQLWEIITLAGTKRGFFRNEDDVTGEWREW